MSKLTDVPVHKISINLNIIALNTAYWVVLLSFVLFSIRTAIYLPILMKMKEINFSENSIVYLPIATENFKLVFSSLALTNPVFLLSFLEMGVLGVILYVFTENKIYQKQWLSTVITTFTISGVIFTIFSVR